jgi:glycosyltransferase involved in cell wall biosynthesis
MERPHISVCICTYKRPALLKRALDALAGQSTEGLFTFSAVVVDNDAEQSGSIAAAQVTGVAVTYCVEPRQNIPLARNRAVANASGDFIAFLDDDEYPCEQWLLTLFRTCLQYGVDGVLGPVKPYFGEGVPGWVVKGNFYNRPYPTGYLIDWRRGRTGNVLLKRELFAGEAEPFRAQFRVGEDQDFFRRMIEHGRRFIWCHEAVAYEFVPLVRCRRTFMWRRALLRGASSRLHPNFGLREIGKSVIAVPAYLIFLPLTLMAGQATFMRYSVSFFDHLGRLLALLGVQPVKGAYVTE